MDLDLEATCRCPDCGDFFWLGRDRDDVVVRGRRRRPRLTPGSSLPADFPATALVSADILGHSWVRVRDCAAASSIRMMTSGPQVLPCECGAVLLVLLTFTVVDGACTGLESVVLRDVCDPALAGEIDLACGVLLFPPAGCFVDSSRWEMSTYSERLARLRDVLPRLAEPLRGDADELFAPDATPTRVWGPMRCAACGDVRLRGAWTSLNSEDEASRFFGPAWPGGDIQPGTRIRCDIGWLDQDCDRGAFVRLRHPVPEDSLTLLGPWAGRGCGCGVGPGAVVLHFVRERGALVLRALELRVVRELADLSDVDLADCWFRTRDVSPGGKPRRSWSRDETIRFVLRQRV